jgi:hypothetical protein
MAHDVISNSAANQAPIPHAVFISYSAKDQATGDAICAALEAQGIQCWIAHRDIPGGGLYPAAIIEAINASRILILVFSSNSNSSNDVMNEVERAFQKEIPIIPFKVENVQPSLGMQYFLSTPQFLNAFTPPLAFHLESLVDTAAALLKVPRKTERKRHLNPIQLKVAVGVLLALVIGALLFFKPLKLLFPVKGTVTVDYEKQYRDAVEMLSSPDLPKRLEGIRSLDKISESGGEYWYWQAMDQLTGYVKEHAPWPGSADQQAKKIPPDIEAILEVIGARPAVYPAHFTERDKERKRRDLKGTDLRGLRLVAKAQLEYVDLEGSNLERAVLTGANLEGAMLKDAVLTNADLGGTCLEGVDLNGADIYNANLRTTSAACGDAAGANSKARRGLNVNNLMLALNWKCARLPDELLNQIRAESGEIPTERCK